MEASLQKFGRSISKSIRPDPNTLYGKRTTIKEGIANFKQQLAKGDEDALRAQKNGGIDESAIRAAIRAKKAKK